MAISELKRTRLEHGLSIKEVAEATGVHPSTVHTWESGKGRPWPKHIRPLAAALGLKPRNITDLIYQRPSTPAA
jgi:transcriptional regulator with XRE-family HTH domain